MTLKWSHSEKDYMSTSFLGWIVCHEKKKLEFLDTIICFSNWDNFKLWEFQMAWNNYLWFTISNFSNFLVPALAGVGAAAGSAAVGAPSSKVIDAHLAVQATIR